MFYTRLSVTAIHIMDYNIYVQVLYYYIYNIIRSVVMDLYNIILYYTYYTRIIHFVKDKNMAINVMGIH